MTDENNIIDNESTDNVEITEEMIEDTSVEPILIKNSMKKPYLRYTIKTLGNDWNRSYKKSAMFGLDARIALAIFGALSVITGAALYSALNKSKAISYLTQMKSLEHSLEAFYLDTGKLPNKGILNFGMFLELDGLDFIRKPSNINNWKGPYTSLASYNEPSRDDASNFFIWNEHLIAMGVFSDGAWTDYTYNRRCKQEDSSCHIYIGINKTGPDIANFLEQHVDGQKATDANKRTGNFRAAYNDDWIFIKTMFSYPPSEMPANNSYK